MKIRNKLFYVSGGLYGQLGNVYAVGHAEGYFLIDCGTPAAYDTILENLRYWGISEKEITHVLLTHGHDDHAGTAAKFQELGAKILVGRSDSFMLESGDFGKESPFQNHTMPPCRADVLFDADTHMCIGGVDIDAYAMPGHTDGFMIYDVKLGDDRVLFTGDFFFCDGERGDLAFTGWKGDMSYSGEKLGNSFKRLWEMQLAPTIILGGHGNPRIGKDAKDLIMIAYKYYLVHNR